MALPGWTRIGGSAERYRSPAGENVSRRQYENARAQNAGWKSWSQYQTWAKSDDSRRWLRIALDNGVVQSRRDVGVESEYAQYARDVETARANNDADALRDPDGPLADYLVYLGLRDSGDDWDMNDTDSNPLPTRT